MKLSKLFLKTFAIVCLCAFSMTALADDIHVATTGNDDNAGTEEAPLATIAKALELVKAGDRILIHEGTYYITKRLKIPALNTNPDMRCELRAWPEDAVGKVIIDGTNMNPASEIEFKQSRCIYVNHEANYWTFYGLVLQNAKDNGMKMEGSYNVVERCTFRWNNDTGLQIGMFKDFSIEETKSFPISGQPEFNPNFSYCRYNKVINCDSYENADTKSYSGSDDGGDADGFAVKLFPGPGTEFHGCRAWTNSDDNWDLYMTYHPVVIDQCWAWHAGYLPNGSEGKNGNGFKLGGGGSAGGANFDHSVGAHVVTNCVAFENLHKGFDQNNAYEGMYIFNCTAWGNEFNYRFPTEFKFGTMDIHNCIGWGATAEKSGHKVGNHEFLSPDKPGYQDPTAGTTYNSWIEIDGCNPIKESYKPDGGDYTPATQDHSGEFLSLSVADFMADREPDGSLPNNNFARLKPGSIFKDKGMPVIGFTPARKMTEEECLSYIEGLNEYITADDIYIPYNDDAPDFGAFELDGVPVPYVIPDKIEVTCLTANSSQEVIEGQPIEEIIYQMNDVVDQVDVEGLALGLTCKYDEKTCLLTIKGTPQKSCTFKVTASGDKEAGVKDVTTTGIIKLVTPYKVLTGDWYLFQDAMDALPVDLQGVLELIQGDNTDATSDGVHKKGDTYIDPVKEEDGMTGAVCVGQSNGGIKLTLNEGVLQCLLKVLFTGGRTFKISYTLANGSNGEVTTSKYSKGTYTMDLLTLAGLTTEEQAKQVRSITFRQSGANGGARIYEMYVKVPVTSTGITSVNTTDSSSQKVVKFIKDGKVIILKNGVMYNVQGQVIK